MKMKKITILGIMLGACAMFSSCNDEWEDELYTQMVSFKAPLGNNSLSEIYIRYQDDETGSYQLPVIVSGSRDNERDIDIKIAIDEDTLQTLNTEKFPVERQDLWYLPLEKKHYSFDSNVCHIPAGTNVALYPIHFSLKGLKLDDKYVLPLTIEKDPSYIQNLRKGRYKALLGINLFTSYSGTYQSSGMNIYIKGDNSNPAQEGRRTARVVDANTVFFYAGSIWIEDVNRSRYKVFVRFEEGTKGEDGTTRGSITLYGEEGPEGTNIRPIGECRYETKVQQHETIKYLERHITTMYLNYEYTDVTSNTDYPMSYEVKGSMTMDREYNPLIPDEDQAIKW